MPNGSSSNNVGSPCVPCLKNRLDDAGWTVRDNVAQDIINELSDEEIAFLPKSLKNRLVKELVVDNVIISRRDRAALDKLRQNLYDAEKSKASAISILKNSNRLSKDTKTLLDTKLIDGIYQAEKKRMAWYESIGIDGNTIGRGQIGEPAYKDVIDRFGNEMKQNCLEITGDYEKDLKDPLVEDFATAAYAAICIDRSQKADRSVEDALKFGIGRYHGALPNLIAAQNEAKDFINYSPVEKILKGGNEKQKDIADRIYEVLKGDNKKRQDIAAYIDEVVKTLNN